MPRGGGRDDELLLTFEFWIVGFGKKDWGYQWATLFLEDELYLEPAPSDKAPDKVVVKSPNNQRPIGCMPCELSSDVSKFMECGVRFEAKYTGKRTHVTVECYGPASVRDRFVPAMRSSLANYQDRFYSTCEMMKDAKTLIRD